MQQQHKSIFVTSDHHPSLSFQELKILDDILRSPLPHRCVVLLRLEVSETWNAWVENWAQKGRAHLLFATHAMKVRHFHPVQAKEHWHFVEGPREMYIIEAGSQPLGSRIDRTQSTGALQGFSGCKRYQFEHYPLQRIHTRQTRTTYSTMNFGDNGMRSHLHGHSFLHSSPAHGTVWQPR